MSGLDLVNLGVNASYWLFYWKERGYVYTNHSVRFFIVLAFSGWRPNPVPILQTVKKYLRVDRREIAFLKFIIEAYDGIAVVSSVDPIAGIVKLSIAPGCEADVELILQDLKKDVMIEPVGE